jgi:DNA-binding NtrC family response regulator
MPALRERKEDIHLLFRKFAKDAAEKFRMPPLVLSNDAIELLSNYRWPGNIRQLKNITEQISILEEKRTLNSDTLKKYLPNFEGPKLPALYKKVDEQTFNSEREILYKVLFDMKNDVTDLKRLVHDLMNQGVDKTHLNEDHARILKTMSEEADISYTESTINPNSFLVPRDTEKMDQIQDTEEFVEESLSLVDKEIELIIKALGKHGGKRKHAAENLGISERTLYRKIKEYNIDL